MNLNLKKLIRTPAPPGEDEYMGEDGLLHCKACHGPRQTRPPFFEEVVTCLCPCQREARGREREMRQQQEQWEPAGMLRARGIADSAMLEWTFDRAEDSSIIELARRYVERWPEMGSQGLLFWGPVGTGKSFAAGCIANGLLDKGVSVLMTSFPQLLNHMGGYHSMDRDRFIRSLDDYRLLIIDDLGVERSTDFVLEQLYAIVDARYRSGKPMLVTTNLTLSHLEQPADMGHARIYSRILERCTPVLVDGKNRRAALGMEQRAAMRSLLYGQ